MAEPDGLTVPLRMLVGGEAAGPLAVLTAPLSFWGGVDLASGAVVDPSHPDRGTSLRGAILVFPGCKGSTAGPGALLELLASGLGPVGIVSPQPDLVTVIGAQVAQMTCGLTTPVAVAGVEGYAALQDASGATAHLSEGRLRVEAKGRRRA